MHPKEKFKQRLVESCSRLENELNELASAAALYQQATVGIDAAATQTEASGDLIIKVCELQTAYLDFMKFINEKQCSQCDKFLSEVKDVNFGCGLKLPCCNDCNC